MRGAGFTQRDITLDLLEGVAKIRYALLVVADLLQQQVNEMGGASPASYAHIIHGAMANRLIEEARHACTIDLTGERNTTGPIVYLLKMIVHQWGFGCLEKVVERHQWVVPVELRQDEVREGEREGEREGMKEGDREGEREREGGTEGGREEKRDKGRRLVAMSVLPWHPHALTGKDCRPVCDVQPNILSP